MTGPLDDAPGPSKWARALLPALAVAVVVRLVLGFALNVDGFTHRGFPFYGQMARTLLDGDGMHWTSVETSKPNSPISNLCDLCIPWSRPTRSL